MRLVYVAHIRLPTERAHGLQIMKTCEALARIGHSVTLIAPNKTSAGIPETDPFRYYGIEECFELIRVPTTDALAHGRQLGRIAYIIDSISFICALTVHARKRIQDADVVYTREYSTGVFLPRDRYVLELHQVIGGVLFTRCIKRASRIIAITEGLKEVLVHTHGIPAQNIWVAPDGVDLNDFASPETKQESRSRLGLPVTGNIALYVGALEAWKGVETFCEAAARLPERIKAVVIGGVPEHVQAYQKKYPRVTFLGFRPQRELANNQACADVLILPNTGKEVLSSVYTSPLKLFTYMASGIPIIASNIPSIREILSEKNATLVPADDPEALANGIVSACTYSEEAQRKAQVAKQDVERYTWEARAHGISDFLTTSTT